MRTSPIGRRSFRGARVLAVGITLTITVVLMGVMAETRLGGDGHPDGARGISGIAPWPW